MKLFSFSGIMNFRPQNRHIWFVIFGLLFLFILYHGAIEFKCGRETSDRIYTVLITTFNLAVLVMAAMLFSRVKRHRKVISVIDKIHCRFDHMLPATKESGLLVYSWLFGGLLLVFACLCHMESRCSWVMFLLIDNILQFSPVIIDACRNFFEHGTFPEINPYQFMGSPTSSTGIYSLLYPVTYIAYAIAKFLCRNELITIDVFCIIHILLAYTGTFMVAKKLQIRSPLAFVAGISYSLCGYHFIGAFYWYYIITTAAFLPFLTLCLICINDKPSWKLWFISGLLWGIYGLSGNVQLWGYTAMFLGLFALYLFATRQISSDRMIFLGSSFMLGTAISLVLLIPQYLLLCNVKRYLIHRNLSDTRFLFTIFLPQNLIGYPIPSEINYVNTVIAVFALAAILLMMFSLRYSVVMKKYSPWLFIGLFALMLAYDALDTWTMLHSLPIFKQFRMSVKFLTYADFFLVMAGIVFLEQILMTLTRRRARIMLTTVVMLSVIFEVNHINIKFEPPEDSAGHQDKMYHRLSEYPPFIFAGKDKFRHISLNASINWNPNYFINLRYNIATHYELMSLNGFRSDLESDLPENMKYIRNMPTSITPLQRYGVKYATLFLIDSGIEATIEYSHRHLLLPVQEKAKLLETKNQMNYYEIPDPDPMAFVEGDRKSLPIKFNTAGADVNLTGVQPDSTVIVNLLWRPRYRAYCDDRTIHIDKDEWGRMKISVTQPSTELKIRYRSPWALGALAGLIFAAAAVGLLFYAKHIAQAQSRS